jgi:hypothetical protein
MTMHHFIKLLSDLLQRVETADKRQTITPFFKTNELYYCIVTLYLSCLLPPLLPIFYILVFCIIINLKPRLD